MPSPIDITPRSVVNLQIRQRCMYPHRPVLLEFELFSERVANALQAAVMVKKRASKYALSSNLIEFSGHGMLTGTWQRSK